MQIVPTFSPTTTNITFSSAAIESIGLPPNKLLLIGHIRIIRTRCCTTAGRTLRGGIPGKKNTYPHPDRQYYAPKCVSFDLIVGLDVLVADSEASPGATPVDIDPAVRSHRYTLLGS